MHYTTLRFPPHSYNYYITAVRLVLQHKGEILTGHERLALFHTGFAKKPARRLAQARIRCSIINIGPP